MFEAFLLELSQGSSDLSVLNWVADTFAKLADGFDDPDGENAQKYYQQADTAFQQVLNNLSISPELANQTKARLANVKFRMKEFDSALQLYQEVLTRDPKAINVQVAVARLLQAWGPQDAKRYDQAINGIEPHVWGWGKIALAAVQHAQFRDTFYEARYEIATCQLALAAGKNGADKKSLLASAERNLSKTAKLYPEMGSWQNKYDTLLKQIQNAR